MQPKLLRALEEKDFERVSGNTIIRSDFRLIAASNQDLAGMVDRGEFRADLFYRLNVVPLHIPPLRERGDDIVYLARYLLQQIVGGSGKSLVNFTPTAEALLKQHTWPENVRELNNVIERTMATFEGDRISSADLPFYLLRGQENRGNGQSSLLKEVIAKAEKSKMNSGHSAISGPSPP